MRRSFPRETAALHGIFAFVREFLDSAGVNGSESFEIDLILEELFTNMVKYHPEGDPEIEIELSRSGERIIIVLTDHGVEPFDITQAPEVDTNLPLPDRKVGGLGLHFVRQMSETITYDHRDGRSTITVTKKLER